MSCPPPPLILVVVAYDSGSRGNPALRGRTAALAAAIADGARLAGRPLSWA